MFIGGLGGRRGSRVEVQIVGFLIDCLWAKSIYLLYGAATFLGGVGVTNSIGSTFKLFGGWQLIDIIVGLVSPTILGLLLEDNIMQ